MQITSHFMFEHALAIHLLWIVLSFLLAFAIVKLYTLASALGQLSLNVLKKSAADKPEKSEGALLGHQHALSSNWGY